MSDKAYVNALELWERQNVNIYNIKLYERQNMKLWKMTESQHSEKVQ